MLLWFVVVENNSLCDSVHSKQGSHNRWLTYYHSLILYIGKQVIEPCPSADKDDSINVSGTVFKGMTYQGLVNI